MADMGDVKDVAVKYWPYILGAVVGLYLISRYAGAGGGTTAPVQSGVDPAVYGMQIEGMRIAAQSGDTRYVADVQREIGMGGVAVQMQGMFNERDVGIYQIDKDAAVKLAAIQGAGLAAELNTYAAIEQARISGATTLGVASIGADMTKYVTDVNAAVSIYGMDTAFMATKVGAMRDITVAQIGAVAPQMDAYANIMRAMNEPTLASINSVTMQNLAALGVVSTLGTTAMHERGQTERAVIAGNVAVSQDFNKTLADIVSSTGYNLFSTGAIAAPAYYPSHITQIENQNRADPETSGIFAKAIAAYFTGGASLAAG